MNEKTKTFFHLALASAITTSAIVTTVPNQANAATFFKDVSKKNAHYKNILALTKRGIIHGFGDGTFRPNQPVTRGQVAKIIADIFQVDTSNVVNPNFEDVTPETPFYGEIAMLVSAGVIKGYSDNTYRPNDILTRGQMAKILAKAFQLKADTQQTPFTDISTSKYKADIAALYANNVTKGVTELTFAESLPVTRGQLASFVLRAEAAVLSQYVTTKVIKVQEGKIVTEAGIFSITGELAKIFNAENAIALQNSIVTFKKVEAKQSSVASLAGVEVATTVAGIVSDVQSIVFTPTEQSGSKLTSVDFNNVLVPNIVVATPQPLWLDKLSGAIVSVSASSSLTLNNSTIGNSIIALPFIPVSPESGLSGLGGGLSGGLGGLGVGLGGGTAAISPSNMPSSNVSSPSSDTPERQITLQSTTAPLVNIDASTLLNVVQESNIVQIVGTENTKLNVQNSIISSINLVGSVSPPPINQIPNQIQNSYADNNMSIQSGEIGSISTGSNSNTIIQGGTINTLNIGDESTASIQGGVLNQVTANNNVTINMDGGSIEKLEMGNQVTLFPDDGGSIGVITVTSNTGTIVLNKPLGIFHIGSLYIPPAVPVINIFPSFFDYPNIIDSLFQDGVQIPKPSQVIEQSPLDVRPPQENLPPIDQPPQEDLPPIDQPPLDVQSPQDIQP